MDERRRMNPYSGMSPPHIVRLLEQKRKMIRELKAEISLMEDALKQKSSSTGVRAGDLQ